MPKSFNNIAEKQIKILENSSNGLQKLANFSEKVAEQSISSQINLMTSPCSNRMLYNTIIIESDMLNIFDFLMIRLRKILI